MNESRELAKKLGPGWKAEQWDNLGWHWRVKSASGYWKVSPSFKYPGRKLLGYLAFLGEGYGGRWSAFGKTPKSAMKNTLAIAREHLALVLHLVLDGKPGPSSEWRGTPVAFRDKIVSSLRPFIRRYSKTNGYRKAAEAAIRLLKQVET